MELAARTHLQQGRWWGAVCFAFGVLFIGMSVALIALQLRPTVIAEQTAAASTIPQWAFWAVWLIIYPAQGVALWLLWQRRQQKGALLAIGLFVLAYLQNLTFWLTNSLVMTAWIDTVGLFLAYISAWAVARVSPRAAWWLLPWLIWMPCTTLYKWLSVFGAV
jgi:translocator protein